MGSEWVQYGFSMGSEYTLFFWIDFLIQIEKKQYRIVSNFVFDDSDLKYVQQSHLYQMSP